jgi:hypothetical protein
MAYPTYNSATVIGTGTNASNPRNKGVMIVNTHATADTVTSIFFTTAAGAVGPEVSFATNAGSVTILPIRFFKTGGTQTNCVVYELT